MSYKIIEKNGVKHKVWSSVEEDFLSHAGGGFGANLFEDINVPTTLRFGLFDAVDTTNPQTATKVFELSPQGYFNFPEFIFLGNRLSLCFDLKKHIPFELHEKIVNIKKCIVTRESNFNTSGHRNAYSNLTTSSMLNLQQDLQFFVQEDYNESVRLHDKLAVTGNATNYALSNEIFNNTGKSVPTYMINKTYVENGNTMTGYIVVSTPSSTSDDPSNMVVDAFFGLPYCILEAISISNGHLVFDLYRPSIFANVTYGLWQYERDKEYEFTVHIDKNDLI